MLKCPFCYSENEDGLLFCEMCKSDLSGVVPTHGAAVPMLAEAVPVLAEPVEAIPMLAEPVMAEAIPMLAEPVMAEAIPMLAEPVMAEAVPVLAEAVHTPPPLPAVPVHVPAPVAPAPVAAMPVPPPAPVAEAAPAAGGALPAGSSPRLVVMRGQKRNAEYSIFEGQNFLGRADDKPVDIDLEDQEPPERVWCSRQHAVITWENSILAIEDLNSANGTFVNRAKIYPGQPRVLAVNDVIQIGNVQMKVVV